jgi:uncharacterized membrane protein/osmotically-inducible protein OsmY
MWSDVPVIARKSSSRREASTHDSNASGAVAMGIAVALASAVGMYYLDPRSGRRRRALLRDHTVRAAHQTQNLLATAAADARNRARGLYHESASRLAHERIDDQTLSERVRSRLGRVCSHPRAIYVACRDGEVTLRGDILKHELSAVLRTVRHVPGVRSVTHDLQLHDEPGRMPFLQGHTRKSEPRMEYLQRNWSPAPRILAGAAGTMLIASGVSQRSLAGLALALGGAALLARSVSNEPLTQWIGASSDAEEGVVVQKTLRVYAEPEEVYSCWRQMENFPEFMSHVREVSKISDTLYHWIVDGPAGVPAEWNAEITADVPGELLAWRTTQDSVVHNSGMIHFEPDAYGGTRVHIRMTYRPPANAMGRTIAKLFRVDPRTQMDEDLARFKSYMEVGKTTGAHGPVVRH